MNLEPAIQHLRDTVFSIHQLTEQEWDEFRSGWQWWEARRKTTLTRIGETEKHLYFVLEGVQHACYQREDGKEFTLVFTYPFSFSGVADSFLLQQPSRYHFETLTASSFIRTTFAHIDAMMSRYHSVETLIRKAVSHTLSGTLERQIELQCFSAEEKFKALLKRSPHVLRLIPHKYLASYLGIDAATFSKLLGTVRL